MKFSTRSILRWLALASFALGLSLCFGARTFASPTAHDLAVPRYSHIFVIVEENKDYRQVMDPSKAPNIAQLAKTYGIATHFYAEVHPSEGNYVAIVSGDTHGINNDDAYFCRPGSKNVLCEKVARPGYVNHTLTAPHIGTQLEQAGLTWKGYYESIPSPGSLATTAGDTAFGSFAQTWQLYASKHSGFINFASVQNSPHRAQELVGFDRLDADLASGHIPSFALVVPNQCNEMHGLDPTDYPPSIAARIPADCSHNNIPGLISRGDAQVKKLVDKIQASPVWNAPQNVAIVITFDEGSSDTPEGCCGIDPKSAANFGGGHIPTIVITNHGPRGVLDATPYSHYSLLRTIEDAFGIHEYLGHSAATDKGVVPMVQLFKKT
jgi:phosphatidylinositol-3-phosphatase